ncbi:MAG: AAA family ATPase [Candidatus Liptonbacteria bacterium]|nr:AAA family ATPase [Candidatus Liptonbacteria bacterium]
MAVFLRKLELNGFKSFAQKTVFEFQQGITAIVGPNGSGKSNIIDAIRWLLGEREARNLRGAKAEDLIFAGTPKKSRLGLAQASLHFDNRSNLFPVDFTEVSVLRQVTRDGLSRYYLNKSEVRLKDIIDFFARARLGTKGFVVVTQGNSDVFVQASPVERREMIEETLGLREYQVKKADAERQMKNAQVNLDKVKALIEEILPHLRSLKRQTHRWEKKSALEEELRSVEYEFFGHKFFEHEGELRRAKEDIESHELLRRSLEGARAAAKAKLDEVEATHPKERGERMALKRTMQDVLEKRSVLEKEIGRLEAMVEMSSRAPHAHAAPPDELVRVVKKIQRELEAIAEGDADSMRAAIRRVLEDLRAVLSGGLTPAARAVPTELGRELSRIRGELEAIARELSAFAEREKILEKNQEQFYDAFKHATADWQRAKEKLEEWEGEHQKKRFEKERLDIHAQELERQLAQTGRRREEFAGYQKKKEFTESELSRMEQRMLTLRGHLASMGDVDEMLVKEARETEKRYQFLGRELRDLEKARGDLAELIGELTRKISDEFSEAMKKINVEFNTFFNLMFGGGQGKMKLKKEKVKRLELDAEGADSDGAKTVKEMSTDEEPQELREGVDIELHLPGKRIQSLDVLSGGEKSLVGIAAIFALISVSPPPFLVLDEIDAALDERNARRFSDMLREFSKHMQFIVVTHNRVTMEAADILYGITMNEDGTSKVLSLKLEPATSQ